MTSRELLFELPGFGATLRRRTEQLDGFAMDELAALCRKWIKIWERENEELKNEY